MCRQCQCMFLKVNSRFDSLLVALKWISRLTLGKLRILSLLIASLGQAKMLSVTPVLRNATRSALANPIYGLQWLVNFWNVTQAIFSKGWPQAGGLKCGHKYLWTRLSTSMAPYSWLSHPPWCSGSDNPLCQPLKCEIPKLPFTLYCSKHEVRGFCMLPRVLSAPEVRSSHL